MKVAVIGVGQAGGKILDALLEYDQRVGNEVVQSALAINTAKLDLQSLSNVPNSNRVLLGQSRVKGQGVGADNDLAATIAKEEIDEIIGALDSVPVHEVDAFLVIAALGGGTGSGAAPGVIRELKRLYTEPVYGLGVLPAAEEGGLYARNAARSLQTVVREADHLLLFDNDAWRDEGETIEGGYESMNAELAQRLGVVFSAGVVDGSAEVGQSVVDSSEVINTLAAGGISTLGYARAEINDQQDTGLRSMFSRDTDTGEFAGESGTNVITSLVRKATLGRLTVPCEVESAERALVIVAGPPEKLSRRGIERARKWVEDETGSLEVRGGDYPLPDEETIAAAVLLAGVTDVPRIEAVKSAGVDADEAMTEASAGREAGMEDLLDGGVDPLF